MNRMTHLLTLAAKEFENDCSPFYHEWLNNNRVSSQEAHDLSQSIAVAIELMIVGTQNGETK